MRQTHFVNTGTPPGMTRQTWIESFKGGQTELHLCQETGTVAVYLTRDPPGNPFPRQPVYHVWSGDSWLYCGQNIIKANKVYQRAIKRSEGG